MAKTLILVRHAQAEQPMLTEDSQRKLTAKGKSDANELGYLLKEQGIMYPQLFCSTAVRALNTAKLIAPAIGLSTEHVKMHEELYNASVNDMLSFISSLDNTTETVAIVAHNPTVSYVAEYFTDEPFMSFPPGSAAIIQFEMDSWNMLTHKSGRLVNFKTVF